MILRVITFCRNKGVPLQVLLLEKKSSASFSVGERLIY